MTDSFVKKYTNAHVLLSNMAFIRKANGWVFQKVISVSMPYPNAFSEKLRKLKKKKGTNTFDPTIDAKLVMLMCKFQNLFSHARNHMFWNICYKLSMHSYCDVNILNYQNSIHYLLKK